MKMFTRTPLLSSALAIGCLLATSAQARAKVYYDYANVRQVTPVYSYQHAGPNRVSCYPTTRHVRTGGVPTAVGAVVGGVVGNIIGESTPATIAGALIGSAVAHESQHRRVHYTDRACQTRSRKVRVLDGYEVTYRYRGQLHQSFVHQHPGNKIKVRVKVLPGSRYGH